MANSPDTIEINGETYIKEGAATAGEWTCFMVQERWVLVGIIESTTDEVYTIRQAQNVRTYGAKTGVEGIVTGKGLKLDDFKATVELPKSKCLFTYALPKSWTPSVAIDNG